MIKFLWFYQESFEIIQNIYTKVTIKIQILFSYDCYKWHSLDNWSRSISKSEIVAFRGTWFDLKFFMYLDNYQPWLSTKWQVDYYTGAPETTVPSENTCYHTAQAFSARPHHNSFGREAEKYFRHPVITFAVQHHKVPFSICVGWYCWVMQLF